MYIGETGRCANVGMGEHEKCFCGTSSGHLAVHCVQCGSVNMEMKIKDKVSREIWEAFLIKKYGDKCVNASSIILLPEELVRLRDCTRMFSFL